MWWEEKEEEGGMRGRGVGSVEEGEGQARSQGERGSNTRHLKVELDFNFGSVDLPVITDS